MSSASNTPNAGERDIAIVGVSVRVPGALSPDEYWKNLKEGVESIQQLSEKELLAAGERPELLRHPKYVRAAALLAGSEDFDAEYFGFTADECKRLDPQHRQLLECLWEALEDAGHVPERELGSTDIFAGTGIGSYFAFNIGADRFAEVGAGKGSNRESIAEGSDLLHVSGARLNLQMACSNSLVAVHLACKSLRARECSLALAAGVSIDPYRRGYLFREDEVLAPDGHCRAFDHKSRGTVGGSGAGAVALRRLNDALADGDHIYAVIKGSAIGDATAATGEGSGGEARPTVAEQGAVALAALTDSAVDADTVDYLECHGSGVFRDDPGEVAGLSRAYNRESERTYACRIGSVKTNIGHLDGAAGVVALIKTSLALENGQIPPSLNFDAPNPTIDFARSPFLVNDKLGRWPNRPTPRRAGVHALGIGGSVAHVILEQAPERPALSRGKNPWQVLTLSARSPAALDRACVRLAAHLERHPEQHLADVAFTLSHGRRSFERRRVLMVSTHREAIELLSSPDPKKLFTQTSLPGSAAVAFLLSGGGEIVGMGKGLYDSEPEFRRFVDLGLSYLSSRLNLDPRDLFLGATPVEAVRENLRRPGVQLPTLLILEYALAKLWISKGVKPTALIGRGVGEITAACLASVMSYEDAVGLAELGGAVFDTTRHSPSPKPTLNELAAYLRKIELGAPQIPFISKQSGDWISDEQATSSDYWAQQLQAPAVFARGVSSLVDDPSFVFLELSPADTLKWLVQQNPTMTAQRLVTALRPLHEPGDDRAFFLLALGRLWTFGVEVDFSPLWPKEQRRRVALPCTALHGQSHPFDPAAALTAQASSATPREDENFEARFYSHVWRQRDADAARAPRRSWLLFLDDSGFGDLLAKRALERGDEVIAVRAGKLLYGLGDGEFRLSPADGREEYETLVRDVLAAGTYVAGGSFSKTFTGEGQGSRTTAWSSGLWGQTGQVGIAAARMGGGRHSAWPEASAHSLSDALLAFANQSALRRFGAEDVVRACERVLLPQRRGALAPALVERTLPVAQSPITLRRGGSDETGPDLAAEYVDTHDDVERALVKIWDELPPLETKLHVDPQALAHTTRGLREEELEIVRLTDGERSIDEVIRASGLIELRALERLAWLYGQGLLTTRSMAGEEPLPRPFRTQVMFKAPDAGSTTPPPPLGSESIIPKFWPPLPTNVAAAPRAPSILPAPIVSVGKAREAVEKSEPLHAPGVELGRYEVLCRIGRGGMGSAYLCRLRGAWGFEQLFCLKVLREHLITDPRAIELFVGEAKIAARLTHPNIVSIVDVGSADDQPYIVMHYVDGASLAQLLSVSAAVDPSIVVTVMLDALAGLTCAHDHVDDQGNHLAFVHCDISPQNILVGVDGGARIADFGVARATRASLSLQAHQPPMRGTPAFASPEQLAGREVDGRSDLFSLGAVFWTALTGEELFPKSVGEEGLAARKKPIPNASGQGRKPPPYFDEICRKALAFDVADRFQSATEFLVALRKVAVVSDSIATPQTVAHWVRSAVGAESEARRSKIAARRLSETPGAPQVSVNVPPLGKPSLELVKWSGEAAEAEAEEEHQTVDLRVEAKPMPVRAELDPRRRWVLYIAAAATLVLIFVAIFKPNAIRSFVRAGNNYDGTVPSAVAEPTPLPPAPPAPTATPIKP